MNVEVPVSLLARLKATKRLPSPPGTAMKVLELTRREDVELQELADVLMSDAALSGRLLKFANSPLTGVGREVTSVREAILLLGLRAVTMTALGFSLSAPEHRPRCIGFDFNQFWAESFASGVIARRLGQEFFSVDREEAFTAGLLAGIGRLALAQGMPTEYARVLEMAAGGTALTDAEQNVLGTDHVEFGAQLLEDWELPGLLVNAVRGQSKPEACPDLGQAIARVVNISTRIAPVFVQGKGIRPECVDRARDVVRTSLKLDEPAWKRLSEQILAEYLQMAALFDVKVDDPGAILDLCSEAQEEATRVGIVSQLEKTEILKANENLLLRATTDTLTGLANRAKFDDKLGEMMRELRRGIGGFSVILFDIDHFKKFNDTYGHPVGDLVLKRVGRAVQNALRDVDLLARYGGEEFAIVAAHADRKAACIVAARVRKCVEDMRVDHNGETLCVTISVGVVVTADYAQIPSHEKLIADVDEQLYLSKKVGRNTWSYRGRSASQVVPAVAAAC